MLFIDDIVNMQKDLAEEVRSILFVIDAITSRTFPDPILFG
jgi:hypothetical protein